MKTRLNATGRHRVLRTMVNGRIEERGGHYFLDLDLRKDDLLALDPHMGDDSVHLEVYGGAYRQRYDCGSLDAFEPLVGEKLPAPHLLPEQPRLRVKVTDVMTGRLRALGDGIPLAAPALEDSSRESILPIRRDNTMDELVWYVNCQDDETPVLHLNDRFEREELVNDATFRALVFPAAVRIVILDWYLERYDDEDNVRAGQWRAFLVSLIGSAAPDDFHDDDDQSHETRVLFADQAASAMARRLRAASQAIELGSDEP